MYFKEGELKMTWKKTIMTLMIFLIILSANLFPIKKVGEVVLEKFQTTHPYKGGNGIIWEKEFYWPKAGYISIHFSSFELAPGDYVEISSPDGKFNYTYSGRGKWVRQGAIQISEFWATHIPCDKAIVRLYGSKQKKRGWGFVIDKWVHGYERGYIDSVLSELEEDQLAQIKAVCGDNDWEGVKCYDGTTMYYNSRSVVRLLINGYKPCTGWLLGNEGHVIANYHCIENQADADNTDYEFMAEGEDCTTDCSDKLACPGAVEANSGTIVKTNCSFDYTLIKLSASLPTKYGYLQFRETLPAIGERIYIPQHPGGWGKQISVNSDVEGPYANIFSTDEPPCNITDPPCPDRPEEIGYYADTAGGSSGSPVIAYNDHLVVSLHHCYNATPSRCPNRGVPIPSIIADLGADLPDNAIRYPYCSTSATNQDYEWIARVKIGTIDHSSGPSGYSNHTYLATSINRGAQVNYTLTPGYSGSAKKECWKIWIDFNRDGDFSDYGERVLNRKGTSTLSGSFFIPYSIECGVTRMRVSMQYNIVPPDCGTFTYGEVEDYSVYIK
jgi:hypothetical protein